MQPQVGRTEATTEAHPAGSTQMSFQRVMSVINSCNTIEQLDTAMRYAELQMRGLDQCLRKQHLRTVRHLINMRKLQLMIRYENESQQTGWVRRPRPWR
jgi:hypothetical protein